MRHGHGSLLQSNKNSAVPLTGKSNYSIRLDMVQPTFRCPLCHAPFLSQREADQCEQMDLQERELPEYLGVDEEASAEAGILVFNRGQHDLNKEPV